MLRAEGAVCHDIWEFPRAFVTFTVGNIMLSLSFKLRAQVVGGGGWADFLGFLGASEGFGFGALVFNYVVDSCCCGVQLDATVNGWLLFAWSCCSWLAGAWLCGEQVRELAVGLFCILCISRSCCSINTFFPKSHWWWQTYMLHPHLGCCRTAFV